VPAVADYQGLVPGKHTFSEVLSMKLFFFTVSVIELYILGQGEQISIYTLYGYALFRVNLVKKKFLIFI
jgi:hypothetical protein